MKNLIFIASIAFAFSSCTNDLESVEKSESREIDTIEAITATYETVIDEPISRMSIVPWEGTKFNFLWDADDVLAVFSEIGTGVTNYEIQQGGSVNAKFKTNGFKIIEGKKYFAFYKFDPNQLNKNAIELDYNGQVCDLANLTSHLGDYNFQYSTEVIAAANEQQITTFSMKNVGSIIQFIITPPATELSVYDKVSISDVPTKVILDIEKCTGTTPFIKERSGFGITLNIEGASGTIISSIQGKDKLHAAMIWPMPLYFANPPVVTIHDKYNNKYYQTKLVNTKSLYESGKSYGFLIPQDGQTWTEVTVNE